MYGSGGGDCGRHFIYFFFDHGWRPIKLSGHAQAFAVRNAILAGQPHGGHNLSHQRSGQSNNCTDFKTARDSQSGGVMMDKSLINTALDLFNFQSEERQN